MSNLFGSLTSAASSMDAFEQGLNVVQSNVTNASTPGYAKQTQVFTADTFDLSKQLPGGVSLGPVLSSRDEFLESAVERNQSSAGEAGQRTDGLTQIQPIFDISSGNGVSDAIDGFFSAVSQLSVSPNDNTSRQSVLDKAGVVAQRINTTANSLSSARAGDDNQLTSQVSSINQLLGQIAGYNKQYAAGFGASKDPGLDANMHNALDSLSELVDFQGLKQGDGSMQIEIGGQSLAVAGSKAYPLSTSFTGTQATVLDAGGKDITGKISSGKIAATLNERNTTIPSYLSDLNTLASTFADNVNSALSNGVDENGNVPATPLFSYDPTIGAAQTLSVNALAPSDLAAASASAPGGNGNALVLADLGRTPQVNGFSFSASYGNLAARVGSDLAGAQNDQQSTTALLTQSQSLRSSTSGVSLNEEAAKLLEFQRSFEASAKLVTAVDAMTVSLIGIIT
jgi:flagellar hook-associated protein 1 FlgK